MGWTQDGKPLVGAVPASLLHGDLRKPEGSVFIGAGFNGHGMPVSAMQASCNEAMLLLPLLLMLFDICSCCCSDDVNVSVALLSVHVNGMHVLYCTQVCSGAGKALSLMMNGESELVHELVASEMAPARLITETVAAAAATASL